MVKGKYKTYILMKYQIGFSIPKGKEWTYKTISTIF
jgi:hypothetical protein